MIDQRCGLLAPGFGHRSKDVRLGHPAEVVLDPGLPACGHHVEIDCAGEDMGMLDAPRHRVGGNPAIVAAGRFPLRIDAESGAMGEQGGLVGAGHGQKSCPKIDVVLGQPGLPLVVPRDDRAGADRIGHARRLVREPGAMHRHAETAFPRSMVEGLEDHDMEDDGKGHVRAVRNRILQRQRALGGQFADELVG